LSIIIELNDADHLRRRVPCRIFTSNGTAPDTGAQGDAVIMAVNSFTTISLSSALTAVHAAQGMYMEQLSQSNVSVLGTHMLYHLAGDFPQHIATIQVVNSNPFSTQSNLLVNSIAAGSYSGVTIQGLSNYANISNVTLHAGTHSNVTIQGLTRINSSVTIADAEYSAVTVAGLSNKTYFQTSVQSSVWSGKRSDWTTPGSFGEYAYSQVTGTSSGTVQGVTRALNLSANGDKTGYSISGTKTTLDALNDIDGSGVTLHVGTHSGATVGVGDIKPASYSGVTVGIDNIKGASYSDVTIQGVTRVLNNSDKVGYALSAAGERSAASSLLSTNLGADRYVQQAIEVLRNRVLISGSTMTVYQTDDTTSSWTATVSTGTLTITQIDPGGA
jgi:hypothetical protein